MAEAVCDDLVEKAVLYISKQKCPDGCNPNRKRQIRKKAEKFALIKGELFFISLEKMIR